MTSLKRSQKIILELVGNKTSAHTKKLYIQREDLFTILALGFTSHFLW